MKKKPNIHEFKALCKANRNLAMTVCEAQAYAAVMRSKVDAYIAPIFEKYTFMVDEKFVRVGEQQERITDIKLLYMTNLDAPLYLQFMQECQDAYKAHGFKGPDGHCPALAAEWIAIQAENALLEFFKEFFGLENVGIYCENRQKMLKLVLGACLIETKGKKS